MAFAISLAQLIGLLGACPSVSIPDLQAIAAGVTTDSRAVAPNQLFLALRGDRFDGHDFVEAALGQGAIAAIVDHPVYDAAGLELPTIVVPDTLTAYQALARWWRQQFTIPVIAVTGSVGKTTTKELIAAVLSTQGRVLKTQANYNNEIGVPKTLLELDRSHDFAVIEMGMRGAGEIALLTQIAQPTVAVITNVGTAHIGRLGSEQAIARAKCELLAELSPQGVAILNYDNPLLMETSQSVWPGRILTYGLQGGDLCGQVCAGETLHLEERVFPLPLPGQHNAQNYLAALAVARMVGVDWASLQRGLVLDLPRGRSQRLDLPNDIVFLDETYNAGLESMLASLKLLVQTPGQRHIAVLGTMKELGERSPEFHHRVGQAVRELHLDRLFILADEAESEAMAAGAVPVATEQCIDSEEVVLRLGAILQPGDRVLFKASRAVGLDQVVNQLQARWLNSTSASR